MPSDVLSDSFRPTANVKMRIPAISTPKALSSIVPLRQGNSLFLHAELVFGRLGNPEDLIRNHNKMIGWDSQEIQAKVRLAEAEVAALSLEFKEAWDKEFKEHLDMPMVLMSVIAG